jgi:hypothetical protein
MASTIVIGVVAAAVSAVVNSRVTNFDYNLIL